MTRAVESRGRLQLHTNITYLDDVVQVVGDEVWTWLRLPQVPYPFQSNKRLYNIASDMSRGLAALVDNAPVQIHIKRVNVPVTKQDWEAQQRRSGLIPERLWNRYVEYMSYQLSTGDYWETRTYLGIVVDRRTHETLFNTGPFAWISKARRRVEKSAGVGQEISLPAEVRRWHQAAAILRARAISGLSIGDQSPAPARIEDICDMALSVTNPGMPLPRFSDSPSRVYGPGIQRMLFNDPLDVHTRSIDFLDLDGSPFRHAAYLVVSRTKDKYAFPTSDDPWLYTGLDVGFPVDFDIRGEFKPASKMAKDLRRDFQHAIDMRNQILTAGKTPTLTLEEQVSQLEQAEHELGKEQFPGPDMEYVFRVWADTRDQLAARVDVLRSQFKNRVAVDVEWPSGDQGDFAIASLPGGKHTGGYYRLLTSMDFLTGGMPTATADVGDRVDESGRGAIGPYIGDILSSEELPLHWSPHNAIKRNKAPGFLFTGSAGSGKTFAGMKIAAQAGLQGHTTIYIDPKGDAGDIEGGTFRLVDLVRSLGATDASVVDALASPPGSLDPFLITPNKQAGLQLATQVLEMLLPRQESALRSAQARALTAEVEDQTRPPTLGGAMDRLEKAAADGDQASDALLSELRLYRQFEVAKLFFAEPGASSRALDTPGAFTVITLQGITLPAAGKDPEKYQLDERLASVVMAMVLYSVRRLLLAQDKNYPKLLLVDEAYVLSSSDAGRRMLVESVKLLRARNGATGMISQSLKDFDQGNDDDKILNNVTTVFAFRAEADAEMPNILRALRMDVDDANRQELRTLETGYCIMRDLDDRRALIRIDRTLDSERMAFETNPDERAKITPEEIDEALTREFEVLWRRPGQR